MCRGGGEGGRHLKYQVGTGEKGGPRAAVFIKDGGFAALDEAAAHQDDAVVRAGPVPLPAAYDTDVRHGTGYIR